MEGLHETQPYMHEMQFSSFSKQCIVIFVMGFSLFLALSFNTKAQRIVSFHFIP